MERKNLNDNLVGIISDTHDNIFLIDEAVRLLNERSVSLVLHAGDYVSQFTVSHFKPLNARLVGVFGNNCAERRVLLDRFKEINMDVSGFFAEVKYDNLKIALLHGHDVALLNSLINSGAYDVVVYGHTHEAKVQRVGGTLVINPGEVCGYVTGNRTLAVLDTNSLKVEMVKIKVSTQ